MINKMKRFFRNCKYWIWSKKHQDWAQEHQKLNIVVDACLLLTEEDVEIEKLVSLKNVFIPLAIWEQIRRMNSFLKKEIKAEKLEFCELKTADYSENQILLIRVQRAQLLINDMYQKKKWEFIGSSGTGIVGILQRTKISELDIDTQDRIMSIVEWRLENSDKYEEYKEIDRDSNLGKLLGLTDLRVIASAIVFQSKKNKRTLLVSGDKIMVLVAKSQNVKALKSLDEI